MPHHSKITGRASPLRRQLDYFLIGAPNKIQRIEYTNQDKENQLVSIACLCRVVDTHFVGVEGGDVVLLAF